MAFSSEVSRSSRTSSTTTCSWPIAAPGGGSLFEGWSWQLHSKFLFPPAVCSVAKDYRTAPNTWHPQMPSGSSGYCCCALFYVFNFFGTYPLLLFTHSSPSSFYLFLISLSLASSPPFLGKVQVPEEEERGKYITLLSNILPACKHFQVMDFLDEFLRSFATWNILWLCDFIIT